MTTVISFTPNRATVLNENDGLYRKKWSVRECQFLVDSGLLEAGTFELLDGEIIYKMGQSREHITTVKRLTVWLSKAFDLESLQLQAPIGIGQSDEYADPEPDVAVLRGIVDDYTEKQPVPATDVLLCAEASKTTLIGDKTTKAMIYGKHGVPEYWIVSIEKRELIVHRVPDTENGGYFNVRTYTETETVSPLERPDAVITVADLLPKD